MATAFTHVFVAGGLTQFVSQGVSKWKLFLVLAFASVVPDFDIVAFKLGIPYEHMLGHRGASHSILFAVVFACPLALFLVEKIQWFGAVWWKVYVLIFLAIISHGVLDAMTTGGLGVGFFIPFSGERFFFDWRPILVSAVNPLNFFNETAIRILKSEFIFVWVPMIGLSVLFYVVRRICGENAQWGVLSITVAVICGLLIGMCECS